MTTIKHISAGLIALAMFTTSAVAHENSLAERHVVLRGNASAHSSTGRSIYSQIRIAGETNTAPRDQPGGICDHGDNPAVC
jgi:hypothetical protein